MDRIRFDGQLIGQMKLLVRVLEPKSAVNYGRGTEVPRWHYDGSEVKSLREVSAIMGVDEKTAAIFVEQDPRASVELKSQAAEVLVPGIYVASDDAYFPMIHAALQLATKGYISTETKTVKMVRTVGGIRRYGQPKGSIIIRDGEAPLDGLQAVENDTPGYEKLADKKGNFYYIGQEGNEWVVRNPVDKSILHVNNDETEVYQWLNKEVGGAQTSVSPERDVFDASPNQKPNDDQSRQNVRDELARDDGKDKYGLNVAQATAVDTLDDDEIGVYKRGRDRGLPHADAYRLAHKPGASGAPKDSSTGRAGRAKGSGTKK